MLPRGHVVGFRLSNTMCTNTAAFILISLLCWAQHGTAKRSVKAEDSSLTGSAIPIQLVNGTKHNPVLIQVNADSPPRFIANGSRLHYRYVLIKTSKTLFSPVQQFSQQLTLSELFAVEPGFQSYLLLTDSHVVSTSCADVERLQRAACGELSDLHLQDLEIKPNLVRVVRWEDNDNGSRGLHVSLQNVTFSCPTNSSSYNETLPTLSPLEVDSAQNGYELPQWLQYQQPPLACAVSLVATWPELFYESQSQQLTASRVLIVTTRNITVPLNFNKKANGTILVYRDVQVMASGGLPSTSQLTYLQLGAVRGEGLWTMYDDSALITFSGLTLISLPLGPVDKYPFSVIPWAFWGVATDRCRQEGGSERVVVANCTLVPTLESMQYSSYWTGELFSPFADKRLAAAWYGIDSACDPPLNRTLLAHQLTLLDQYQWAAKNASAQGITYLNTLITNKLDGLSTETPSGLPLTKLFTDPYAPFPSITWISTAAELVDALAGTGTPHLMVLANISVPPHLWQEAETRHGYPLTLRRSVEVAGWPNRATVIDWQGATGALHLDGNQVSMRNLVLMNGGQGRRGLHPAWAVNLTMYQWPLVYGRTQDLLRLQSVRLVVPQDEYTILLGAHGAPASSTAARLGGVTWTEAAVIRKPGTAYVALLVDDGIFGSNVTITTTPVAFEVIPLEVVLINPTPTLPAPTGGSGDGLVKVAIAVPVAVVGSAVLLMAGYWVFKHRQDCARASGRAGGVDASQDSSTNPSPPHAPSPLKMGGFRKALEGKDGEHGHTHAHGYHANAASGDLEEGTSSSAENLALAIPPAAVTVPDSAIMYSTEVHPQFHGHGHGPFVVPVASQHRPGSQHSHHSSANNSQPHNSYLTPALYEVAPGVSFPMMQPHQPHHQQHRTNHRRAKSGTEIPGGDLGGLIPGATGGHPGTIRTQGISCPVPQPPHGSPLGTTTFPAPSPVSMSMPAQTPMGWPAWRQPPSPQPVPAPLPPQPPRQYQLYQSHLAPNPHPHHGYGAAGDGGGSHLAKPGSYAGPYNNHPANVAATNASSHHAWMPTSPMPASWHGSGAGTGTGLGAGSNGEPGSGLGPGTGTGGPWPQGAQWPDAPHFSHPHQHPYQPTPSLGSGAQWGGQPLGVGSGGGVGRRASLGSDTDGEFHDSFDRVPADNEQLLINRMEMSRELQASISTPDVAHQLKAMVIRLQSELGDQEVDVTRVIGQGGCGVVYMGTWRGLTVAVKTLVFTVLPHQPMSRSQHRAMTEAAICRTLHHPNIVATYAYDLHELSATRPHKSGSTPCDPHQRSGSTTCSGSSEGDGGVSVLRLRGAGPDPPGPIENVDHATEFKLAIIQEYCNGGTLREAVDDCKLHERTRGDEGVRPAMGPVLQLAVDVAAGMAHVHARNIVHGDLTPANVLLKISAESKSQFIAKVSDFGLSWKLSNGQQHVSNARQGTGFYIAPEVLHVGIMSKRADVFSFGMILHEMYHGTPPWRRHGQQRMAVCPQALQRPGLDQLEWAPHCPPDLRDLISRCVDPDPQSRPTFFVIVEKLLAMQREQTRREADAEAQAQGAAAEGTADAVGAKDVVAEFGQTKAGATVQGDEDEEQAASLAASPAAPAATDVGAPAGASAQADVVDKAAAAAAAADIVSNR